MSVGFREFGGSAVKGMDVENHRKVFGGGERITRRRVRGKSVIGGE